jgi:hypothetical protein
LIDRNGDLNYTLMMEDKATAKNGGIKRLAEYSTHFG